MSKDISEMSTINWWYLTGFVQILDQRTVAPRALAQILRSCNATIRVFALCVRWFLLEDWGIENACANSRAFWHSFLTLHRSTCPVCSQRKRAVHKPLTGRAAAPRMLQESWECDVIAWFSSCTLEVCSTRWRMDWMVGLVDVLRNLRLCIPIPTTALRHSASSRHWKGLRRSCLYYHHVQDRLLRRLAYSHFRSKFPVWEIL